MFLSLRLVDWSVEGYERKLLVRKLIHGHIVAVDVYIETKNVELLIGIFVAQRNDASVQEFHLQIAEFDRRSALCGNLLRDDRI